MIEILFQFIVGHAFADYVFQGETMAVHKNRNHKGPLVGNPAFPNWYYWLTMHSFIHAAAVYLITTNITLALIEVVLHWLIDFIKCEDKINIHMDQFLHILCKIGYLYYLGYI